METAGYSCTKAVPMTYFPVDRTTDSPNLATQIAHPCQQSIIAHNNFLLFFLISAGNYVLAWKRGIAILTAANVKVTPDPRVRLVNKYTLQIRDALPTDAGDYICQIATLEPREITHHVEILSK